MSSRARSRSPRAPNAKAVTTRQRSNSPSNQKGEDWFFAGLVSSFPDITPESSSGATQLNDSSAKATPNLKDSRPEAKPRDIDDNNDARAEQSHDNSAKATPTTQDTHSEPDDLLNGNANEARDLPSCRVFSQSGRRMSLTSPQLSDLSTQILIFRYRTRIHAIDHRCPHMSHPLSQGSVHDIEDFGIVLSAGITCPKHGWDFDLFTGEGDRGSYALGIWDVQLRPAKGNRAKEGDDRQNGENGVDGIGDQEVWVRRKRRRREG